MIFVAGRRVLVAVESGPVAHTGRDWRNNLNQDSNSFNQDSGVGVSGPAARVGADSGGGGGAPLLGSGLQDCPMAPKPCTFVSFPARSYFHLHT